MFVQSKFSPRWWLRNPHLQTVLASKLLRPPPADSVLERHELADGDFLDLAIDRRTNGPTVVMFHGLAGCIDSSYIRGAWQALRAAGFRPVLMHWRGCSGEPNRLARSYHSGCTDDIEYIIGVLQTRFADQPLHALGFSLGGNALIKYLGETGSACALTSAMAVCPPLVLATGADTLNTGLAKGYQRYLLALMRRQYDAKRRRYPDLGLAPLAPDLNSFWRFDDAVTAPLHGFVDVHDYYTRCSARQFLAGVRIPLHILFSLDDPFFSPSVVPTAHELDAQTTLEITLYGGHVGFLGTASNPMGRWLDAHIARSFADRHSLGVCHPESDILRLKRPGSSAG